MGETLNYDQKIYELLKNPQIYVKNLKKDLRDTFRLKRKKSNMENKIVFVAKNLWSNL